MATLTSMEKRADSQDGLGERRRRELVEATIRSIARHGIADASVEKITDEAGMSRSAIRYHFGSKGDLLVAVYRSIADDFRRRLDRPMEGGVRRHPLARINAWFEILFRPPYLQRHMLSAWIGLTHAAETDPQLRATNREIYGWQRASLAQDLAEAAAHKGVSLDADRAAAALMALMDGLWLELTIDPDKFDPKDGETICKDFVQRLLR